jgi:hypothetical protein
MIHMNNAETTKAATGLEPGASVGPSNPASKRVATRKERAPKAKRAAKGAKARGAAPKKEPKPGRARKSDTDLAATRKPR